MYNFAHVICCVNLGLMDAKSLRAGGTILGVVTIAKVVIQWEWKECYKTFTGIVEIFCPKGAICKLTYRNWICNAFKYNPVKSSIRL